LFAQVICLPTIETYPKSKLAMNKKGQWLSKPGFALLEWKTKQIESPK
jgi:hypothetical protein